MAADAVRQIAPFMDGAYPQGSIYLEVSGQGIHIPKRLRPGGDAGTTAPPSEASPTAKYLLTRSIDADLRQKALKSMLELAEVWTIPFASLLTGGCVIKIENEALHALGQVTYSGFVRADWPGMRILRSRATRYWNVHDRQNYPDKSFHPGLAVLDQQET